MSSGRGCLLRGAVRKKAATFPLLPQAPCKTSDVGRDCPTWDVESKDSCTCTAACLEWASHFAQPMMCMCESRVAASDSHNADCSAFQAVSSIKNAAQFCLQHEFCWSAFRSAFQVRSHLLLIRHIIAPGMIETTQPSERSTITCDRPPLSRRRGKDLASLQDTGYIR